MKILQNKKLFRGVAATSALVLAVATGFTTVMFENRGLIDSALGLNGSTPTATSNIYYKSNYGDINDANWDKLQADIVKHNIDVMGEGAVLLKNNGVLPLSQGERKVTLLGNGCLSGWQGAFTSGGYSVNTAVINAYSNANLENTNAQVQEISVSALGSTAGTFSEYGDAAIIVLKRTGSEGKDHAVKDADGVPLLSLHEGEKALLEYVASRSEFKKTIVIVDSANQMELGWVDETRYGVDACVWVAPEGNSGFNAIPELLSGKRNFSGKLVDTFAANSLSSPAMQNYGNFKFTNSNSAYIVEAEGIYVGYKYYETRYQDQILGINNASSSSGAFVGSTWNYADEMCYPFGYGLSYTNFEQKLTDLTWNREKKTVTASVEVKNTGNEDGKAIVQLYAQLPYEYGVTAEKSAIQLIGYEKTDVLPKGGAPVTVTVEVDEYLFATYDQNAHDGKGGYVYDAGDYYFAIGDDCHDALNNVLAAREETGMIDSFGNSVIGRADNAKKVNLAETDSTTYAKSSTGAEVSNKFEHADLNYYMPGTVTYLTRNDWTTFPKTYDNLTATDKMIAMVKYESDFYDTGKVTDKAFSDYKLSQVYEDKINFIDMKEVPLTGKYTDVNGVEQDADKQWEKFLDQLSVRELTNYLGDSFMNILIQTVNKPKNVNVDGPEGMNISFVRSDGTKQNAAKYNSSVVCAATWNRDLIEDRAYYMSEEALFTGVHLVFGSPACNTHRVPYCGRNVQYLSEDGIVNYEYGVVYSKKQQEKGLISMVKHLAANNQETNRNSACTFMSEQALREIELKAFEGSITKGGALGVMSSYNLIGCVPACSDRALLTDVLRGEWGFDGYCITDAKTPSNEREAYYALLAGTDMWCLSQVTTNTLYRGMLEKGDANLMELVRQANKRIYHTYSQSSLINGLATDTVIAAEAWSWWQGAMVAIDVIFGVLALGGVAMFVLSQYTNLFNKKTEPESNS